MNFSVDFSALDDARARVASAASMVEGLSGQVTTPDLSCFGKLLEPAASITFPGATDDGRDFLSALAEADEGISKKLAECVSAYEEVERTITQSIASVMELGTAAGAVSRLAQ